MRKTITAENVNATMANIVEDIRVESKILAFAGKSGSNKVQKEIWEFLLRISEKEIRTLPVNFYTKSPKQIKVVFETKTKNTSFYAPDKNMMSISFFNVFKCFAEKTLEEIKNDISWVKGVLRGQFYHELSHAILTPSMLMVRGGKRRHNDVLNVIEDERIETIKKDTYKGVNFKRGIIELCEWKGQEADNAWTYFFQVVRFRHGEQEHLDLVSDFIIKWFDLTGDAFQSRDAWSNQLSYDYIHKVDKMRADMLELYRTIIRDWFADNFPDELRAEAEKLFGQQPDYSDKEWKDAAEALIDSNNKDDDDDYDEVIIIEGPQTIDNPPTPPQGPKQPKDPDGPKRKIIFKDKVTLKGQKGEGGESDPNTDTEFQGGLDDQRTGEDKSSNQNNKSGKVSGKDIEGTDRRAAGKSNGSNAQVKSKPGQEGQEGEPGEGQDGQNQNGQSGQTGEGQNGQPGQAGQTGEPGEGQEGQSGQAGEGQEGQEGQSGNQSGQSGQEGEGQEGEGQSGQAGEGQDSESGEGQSGQGQEGESGEGQEGQNGDGQDGQDGQNGGEGSNQPDSPTSSAGKGGDPSNSEGAQTGEGTGEEGEGDRSRSQNGGKTPGELAKEAAEKAAEDIAKAIAAGKGGKNSLSDLANKDYDPDVYRGLEELFIKRVRKDRKTQGRNVGWTGRIDPRLLSKGNNSKTKKIFVKENKDESNKFKGKEFINLIMVQDTSGSYSSSERATNVIFEALDRIEALHKKMFRWNLITVSNGIDVREKDDHKIRACGGTELTPDIYGAIKGFESTKGLNIYVTLFDGSCYGGENFAAMNKKNSIIIDNRTDNQEDIDRYAPKAVRVSVTDGDFAGKLYSILYKELDKILR